MIQKLLKRFNTRTHVLCVLSLFALHSSAAAEGQLNASVTAEQSVVHAFSCLLVRATLENKTGDALQLTQPVTEMHGTVRVLLRRPGSEDFGEVKGRYFGLKDSLNYRSVLQAGETIAAHVLLLCDRDEKFVFDKVGEYQLRVAIEVPPNCVTSATVNIDVKDATGDLLRVVREFKKDMSRISLYEALPREQLLRLKSALAWKRSASADSSNCAPLKAELGRNWQP